MDFTNALTHYSQTVSKLRNREVVTYFNSHSNTFYRFRINPDEKQLFWMKEASLDKRNWVCQNHFLGLKDVLIMIYNIKINNHLDQF